ncbi:MAG TPA: hypothetical protein V6C88_02980 [Chroococcidiopsis sp.]
MAALLSVLAVSCGESKVSQCNKLIEVANKAVSEVQAVTASAQPQDVTAMTKIADTADAATAEMQALELADESLKGYQQRFVTMYTDTSKATRELVDAVGKKDSAAAEASFTALQAATSQESGLVGEVNTYCGAGG